MALALWKTAAVVVGLAIASTLTGCEQKPAGQAATTAPAGTTETPVLAAAYSCPMGCEGSASSKPGKCPVCGMELEANPAAKAAPSDSL
ncbi:heavy metal-binding domain-containing protein [Hymenobacter mucosus]|uniref:Heavy metal binding domain-containing protein n=1 Tax=Hymenobacter mucosus TaxID=1411120 RepID=A0A238WWQ6_9BACT|nr:heavy metal-binding domain-containing protein [Hymenobacter mucosus]SNR50781.1 hypothetical protein SAMN06269173_103184 [Hymenobacter mucosus]